MSHRHRTGLGLAVLVGLAASTLLLARQAWAATINVPVDYFTIQAAINAASDGDTIQVAAGTYRENLVWNTKNLQLLGAGAGVSIVNGDVNNDGIGDGACLSVSYVPAAARVQGFTFCEGTCGICCQNASSLTIQSNTISGNSGTGDGAGIYCWFCSPTIQDNTISGNTTTWYGGGIYCYDASATIQSNTISGNTAGQSGGGVFVESNESSPTIDSNTISGNIANCSGGGIFCNNASGAIHDNTISGNSAVDSGGGICCWWGAPTIENNIISDNSVTDYGGGICCWRSSPTIQNNTLSGNAATVRGGGIYADSCSPAIGNCIIAFSSPGEGIYTKPATGSAPTVSYSDVFGNAGGNYGGDLSDQTGSNGNISRDPLFASAGGGYHLKSVAGRWDGSSWVTDAVHSPCIDRGDPGSAFANEPAPNGGRVNMGRWGNTAQASKSAPVPSVVWVDDDFTVATPGWGWDHFAKVQDGLDAVADGGTVHVAAGTYRENLLWEAKDLQLLGAGPAVSIVNGDVNKDGTGDGSCLRMTSIPATARVQGFTFRDGKSSGSPCFDGGGIFCDQSAPIIQDNVITGNSAGLCGGGIYCRESWPIIQDNAITGNSAGKGGGIYCAGLAPTIQNSTIGSNSAAYGGGIFCDHSSPTIQNSTISGNTVNNYGGGIFCDHSSPTIQNSTIGSNSAGYGGGIFCQQSSPTIQNSTISGNTATYYAGGVYCWWSSPPTMQNNTISGNSATVGGGMYCYESSPTLENNTISGNAAFTSGGGIYCGYNSSPTVRNCIIAFSSAGEGIRTAPGSGCAPSVTYCDAFGNAGGNYGGDLSDQTGSNGNISEDPLFASAGSDYHLKSLGGRWNGSGWVTDTVHSPCIDAGDPASPFTNEPAPNGNRINMGAYGNTEQASKTWVPVALEISHLEVTHITRTGAVVNWTTNLAASSEVGFDTSSKGSYEDYTWHASGPGGTCQHAVVLAGLTEDTTYYLRARSTDKYARTVTSDEISFTTSDLLQPAIAYTGDTTASLGGGGGGAGGAVRLAATLHCGETALAGKTLTFLCEDWVGTGVTDGGAEAEALVSAERLGQGAHTVLVRFAGDAEYLPASGRGEVTIEVDVTHTIVRGHGLFYKEGNRTERCLFSFRFNDDLEAGWLKFFDVRAQMSVEVGTVKQVTVTGTQATIVCGDSDEYTIEVDAATDYFKLTGPGYQADSGHSTRDRCEIVIEELTPE